MHPFIRSFFACKCKSFSAAKEIKMPSGVAFKSCIKSIKRRFVLFLNNALFQDSIVLYKNVLFADKMAARIWA